MIKKVASKYGLISGPFFLLVLFWTYFIGINPFSQELWLVFICIYGVFIFFADYEFKNYYFGGYLHFWQGMTIGMIVWACSTLIFSVGLFIWLNFDDQLRQLFIEKQLEILETSKSYLNGTISEEYVRNRSNFGLTFQMTVQNNFLSGFTTTTFIALILRKKPK